MSIVYQIICVVLFVWVISYLSAKNAQNKAKIERLKQEIKDNERTQKIINNIDAMSSDDVRARLSEISNK